VDCSNIPDAVELSASDLCDADVDVIFDEVVSSGECPYTITRTWTATDDYGNQTSVTQVLTVVDDEAPVFGDYPITTEAFCDEVDALTIDVTDNCDSDVELTFVDILFSGSCYGTLERTWTATDNCGNSTSVVQFIFLRDETAPVILNGPESITISCDEEVPPVSEEVMAMDNCDDELELVFTETQSGTTCPYIITRTWTVEDDCGNIAEHVQVITVVTENPVGDVLQLVSPNPASNVAFITMIVPKDGAVRYEVMNSLGQKVDVIYIGNAEGGIEYRFELDVTQWKGGVNYTRLIFDDEVHTERIIKLD